MSLVLSLRSEEATALEEIPMRKLSSADVRARVDSKDVRKWIKSQIDQRFPF